MDVKKIVLAYSGGLDTSVILKWLEEEYECPVIAYAADVGQTEDWDAIRKKGMATGAEKVIISDLRQEFVEDYIFPAFRCNAIYEGSYQDFSGFIPFGRDRRCSGTIEFDATNPPSSDDLSALVSGTGTGGPGYNINAEFNSTPHVEGVLSMARSTSPNSAGSQFFICLGSHTHLDNQYTAFGRTADEASMEVVRKIGSLSVCAGWGTSNWSWNIQF